MEANRYIFISYKRDDVRVAALIRTALESCGYDVWFDEDVQCGQQWATVIDDMLANAGCVVVLWSELANASPWVRHEASHAMTRNVYAPCRIELISIDAPYNHVQATDILDWQGELNHPGFQDLVNRIGELIPPKQTLSERVRAWAAAKRVTIFSAAIAATAFILLIWQTLAIQDQLEQSRSQLAQMVTLTEKQEIAANELDRLLHPLGDLSVFVIVDLPIKDARLEEYRLKIESRLVNGYAEADAPDTRQLLADGFAQNSSDDEGPIGITIRPISSFYPDLASFENSVLSLVCMQVAIFRTPIKPNSFRPYSYDGDQAPDLKAHACTKNASSQQGLPLNFNLRDKSMQAEGSLKSKAEGWNTSGKIVSVKDLSNAQLFIAFGPLGLGEPHDNASFLDLRKQFRITYISIRFGKRMATIHSFDSSDKLTVFHTSDGTTYWVYHFPKDLDALFKG